MKKLFPVFVLLSIVVTSCNTCDCNKYSQEVGELNRAADSLLHVLDSLQHELDSYHNHPSKLLARAEAHHKDKDMEALEAIHAEAQRYHPESKEAKEIHRLLSQFIATKRDSISVAQQQRSALARLNKSDDGSGTIWYYQPYFIHHDNRNLISVCIEQRGKELKLHLKMSYTGYDGIFFTAAHLAYEGNLYNVPFDSHRDKKMRNKGAGVSEWIEIPVSAATLQYLRKFANAQNPRMQLSGKSSYTHALTPNEVKGLKDILLAYDALKK